MGHPGLAQPRVTHRLARSIRITRTNCISGMLLYMDLDKATGVSITPDREIGHQA